MIYVVAPNAKWPSGGVGVAAQWVRLLNEQGHPATFITPDGDPSPYWMPFTVPAGSYGDMGDHPGNIRIDIWMDCMMENLPTRGRHYYFAQDVCQPDAKLKERGEGYLKAWLTAMRGAGLITIGRHSHDYYLYRFGLRSSIVNNWVDTDLFQPGEKASRSACLINHRDHFNPEIPPLLEAAGYKVRIAQGSQAEVARVMGESQFFISDVRGRFDGFAYSEGFPMPIAEAMASGCVALCRDTGGVREYLMDQVNGLFYKDIAEIPILLADAGNQRIWWEMGEVASYTMQEKFTRENAWTQIREALELT